MAEQRTNKQIIWEHFTDSLLLLVLEFGLAIGIDRAGPFLHGFGDIIHLIHICAKWFTLAVFFQFCIDSLIQLTIRQIRDLKGAA